jgi:uncharacterized protein (DUF1697 family)
VDRYVAFLRGINVGGHRVTMERMRELFCELELTNVTTVIASGNVVFEATEEAGDLEARIEDQLQRGLGYRVATFVRSATELASVIANDPLADAPEEPAPPTVYVVFLKAPPVADVQRGLAGLRSETDEFHVVGREVYWLCRTRMSESPAGDQLERTLREPGTMRKITTLNRLLDKLSAR